MSREGFHEESIDGLPVHGYTSQSDANVALVNEHKEMEERILRRIDWLSPHFDAMDGPRGGADPRWLAVARTHIEQGFMALNRAIFRPTRIKLKDDEA